MNCVSVGAKDILSALGYKNRSIGGPILELAEEAAIECENALELQYASRILKISSIADGKVILETGDELCFEPLARAFAKCSHVIIAVITIGGKLDEMAKSCSMGGDPLKAMMYDAFGTMAVTNYSELVRGQLIQKLRASKELPGGMTRGYHPGENGWELSQQEVVFQLVDTASIGVTLDSYYIMHPSKTVSSVLGIGNGTYERGHDCAHCTMENCVMRGIE